ncbi:sigma 54-interacting transcriptional regulator, partial [Clostridiaceae bacterium UIB06]|nr:sigma 54-interacting transcriptional regulator [Clostridiaceae bacterium UIB06]
MKSLEEKVYRKSVEKIARGCAIYTFDKIIGKSESFISIMEYAKKISDSTSTVLITGESGTGKEVFAQAIHNSSSRRDKIFVAVNCGAIPSNLIESELLGYEEGAFTGAKKGGNAGKFEMADGGTIFL